MRLLVAFDFDHTIIEHNSDVIVKNMLPKYAITREVDALYKSTGWTLYMQEIFKLLKQFHIGEETIREAVVRIPPAPGIPELFQYLKTIECEKIVLSDSNSYFIEEWLRDRAISVDKIYTNPASFSSGILHISPYHNQDWCDRCSTNLCKGYILEEHIKNKRDDEGIEFFKVLYIGDGANDLCPSTKLSKKDIVFPRRGYNLDATLVREPCLVDATVSVWEDTNFIVDVIKELLEKSQDNN